MKLRTRLRRFEPWFRHARPLFRRMRTWYLRRRYPRGAYLISNGVRVYADFHNLTYEWYDADTPTVAFERQVLLDVMERSGGNVFIDVGAHFGYFAKIMAEFAATRRGGKVIAVEPDRDAFHCLGRTLAGSATSVALNLAAGDADGELTMYRVAGAPCLHSYAESSGIAAYRVAVARLDSVLAAQLDERDEVAVIKVDIDGAEWSFLDGAAETLSRHRPILIVEFSPGNLAGAGVDPRAFLQRLNRYGAIQWVRLSDQTLSTVTPADADSMIAELGARVSDLVVTPE